MSDDLLPRSDKPLVSVIIATYNQARVLPHLLDALADQEDEVPTEIIVCDDGSGDGTATVLATWTASRPSVDVRYVWQPDRGFRVSRSRNNGIRLAQGDVLVFLDDDVWVAPWFVRDHWNAHQSEERRLVCGWFSQVVIPEQDLSRAWDRLPLTYLQPSFSDRLLRQRWLSSERPWFACTSGNFSIHSRDRMLFDENFEGWGSEDRDYAYRIWAAGAKICVLDRAGAIHLRIGGEALHWNPFKGGDQEGIVAALESKLQLSRKYPGDTMAPSLELVRRFYLDPASDQWIIDPVRQNATEHEVLDQFVAWKSRHSDRKASEFLGAQTHQ